MNGLTKAVFQKNTEVENFKQRHLESNFVDAEWGGAEVDLGIVCWTGGGFHSGLLERSADSWAVLWRDSCDQYALLPRATT